ncbi:MAG: redoxin domain-containing protein [Sedimentisphaerales bacterium]|nr:redoxin domain-containing protein [Sedimentisphaerales bacterium]
MSELVGLLNSAGVAFIGLAGRMLVQSSLLILALVILDLVLRKRVKAVVRYWIWLLVIAKLLLPPSFSSPTGLAYWIGARLPSLPTQAEPAVEAQPAFNAVERPVVSQVRDRGAPATASGEMPHGVTTNASPVRVTDETSGSPAAIVAVPPAPSIAWQAALLVAWAVVVLVMIVLLIQRALFVRCLVRQSDIASERLIELLGQCRLRMAVAGDVGLRLSSLSMSPSVCGLRRPIILVPRSMLAQLDAMQLKSVLLHELAHIKRGDLWINLAQALLQVVYFFHPLLWLANAIIRRVREQAVDETVLAAMGAEAEEYPKTLLSVSRLAFGRPSLSLRLLGVVESKKALTARIRHIVSRPFPKSAKLGCAGLVLIVATAACLLPMAKAQPQENKAGEAVPVTQAARTADSNSASVTETVEGIVTDSLGRPRQGVYVAPQGANLWKGVMSDAQGRFRLENVQPDQKLSIAWSQASRSFGLFALPEAIPTSPIRVVLNLGEADLEGRVAGADGKPLANRKVEVIVSTPDGIRFPLDHQPQTDAYGYYSHSSVPCGEGVTMEARLVDAGEVGASFSTVPVQIRANQYFIEMPLLVAARQKIQPDFDRNTKDDGMLHCAGRVLDEAGKPIAGVRVRLSFDMPDYMAMWVRDAMTDEQGRWHRPLPPKCMNLSVEFEHPEYYLDDRRSRPPRDELVKGTHTAVMKRGLCLEGKVTDEQGEPVENVLVCGSRPSSFTPGPYNQIIEDSGMARTLRDGTFYIRGLAPGARTLTVYPDRYAPAIRTVDIREDMDPVSVILKAGRTYRGQVVDVQGNPMEGIRVGTQEWRLGKEQCHVSRLSITDAQGMFALTNLPEGQIEIDFGRKKGYLGFNREMPADLSQVDRVVMYEVPVFVGRVVDADTNAPVTDFEVVNGIRRDMDASLDWSRYYKKHVEDPNGAFRNEWAGYGFSYPSSAAPCIKIEAKGYVPSAPVLLELGKTCEPLTIRMNKGTSIAGTVLEPDGDPAAKAQVALVRNGELAFIDRDQFSATGFVRQAEIVTTADAQGRFELPAAAEPGLVVAVHRTGYAQVRSAQFASGSSLRLTAWSRVEGTLDRSRIAEKEVAIVLSAVKEPDKQTPGFYWLFSSVTPTNDTFAFDCVPSVPLAAGRMSRYELHGGHYFVPEAGKTHRVHIGEQGRAVTGRIVPPAGLLQDRPIPFTDPRCVHAVAFRADTTGVPAEMTAIEEPSFNWLWQDKEVVYKPSTTRRQRFVPAISDDGTFTFGGLESGAYELVINVHAPLGENVSCGRGVLESVVISRFTVPDGKAASAVTVPDIALRPLTYPKVGEPAPLFEARTFDGRTIKLADLRGKVVLLDFWATWCSPCVAQLPQVQQIHEAFRDSDKFAMIGMSLDWDIERAENFLARKPLKWSQVSLGNMETSPVVRQYGVGDIPMTVLIDPEGKILARGVPIDQLKERIRTALAIR